MLAQVETAVDIVNKASSATDRWLFLAALAIIIIGGSMVIRWLVASLDKKDASHNKEMQELRGAHGTERSEWRTIMETSKTQFLTAIMEQRKDFREELSVERHACAQERILDREARHATAGAMNHVALSLQVLADDHPKVQEQVDQLTKTMQPKSKS